MAPPRLVLDSAVALLAPGVAVPVAVCCLWPVDLAPSAPAIERPSLGLAVVLWQPA